MDRARMAGGKRSATAAFGPQPHEAPPVPRPTTTAARDVRNSLTNQDGARDDEANQPTWTIRRTTINSIEPDADSQCYDRVVGPDLRREIMQTLLDLDPLGALRFAATDRQHHGILESLKPPIVRKSALIPIEDSLTARRLLAANVGLGRRLAGGASPRDWEMAAAAGLMEGFVRFLCAGVQKQTPVYARYAEHNVDCAADTVSTVLDEITLEERVSSLYEWIMKGSFGAFLTRCRRSRLRSLLTARDVHGGYFSRRDYGRHLAHLGADGVRVGDHPCGSWKGDGADGLSPEGRALHPILSFPRPRDWIFPGAIDRSGCPLTWLDHATGEIRAAPIGSSDAETGVRAYLDDRVRRHMVGPCAHIQAAGGIILPAFSQFFPGAVYLVNMVPDVTLMVDLRSPRIERLCGQSFNF
ncbi:hypothetical protein pdul_cds_684 [Pandoravirus dulcis]|uniref:Uncharacterized protein n=1 Tax=Pandoravirus dulcis TaxID=1349409 RepID=S4VTT7_9VIRU|nr:hypothetical protein pdul_cds_684 [Pandoravirus dulcis]AGO82835.2 hypothetical protein pdul_cds_684 [Pandoravirus dulcis]